MITSMTGYASAAATRGSVTVTVELRTYNSRALDLALRLPSGYADLEERVRAAIAAALTRGRVEARVQVEDSSEAAGAVEPDLARGRAVFAALERLRTELGVPGTVSLDLLVGAGGLLKTVQPKPDIEAVGALVEEALAQGLKALNEMRATEGRALARDLDMRLGLVEEALASIRGRSADLVLHYQDRLKERITALTQGLVSIDPTRIAQEAAFLADRSDISEEVVRAESHLQQFRAIMDAPAPAGRKLNFLLQELNREFNTMGSKISNAPAAHVVVDVKTELEKIREQIQNVE
jgi:uncharacterized protein (TIGR00255 family)